MADGDSDSDTDGPVTEVEARRAAACEAYARGVLGLLEESGSPPFGAPAALCTSPARTAQ
jgi:hypothetical protein